MENQEKESRESVSDEEDDADDCDHPISNDLRAKKQMSTDYSTLTEYSECESEYSTIVYQVGKVVHVLLEIKHFCLK